ncbi:MAG: hypothetical protein ACOX19_04090 [Fermentimonas sp.]
MAKITRFIASNRCTACKKEKDILIAFLVLLPTAILIGWKEPVSLIPIIIMTTISGGVLGFSINKTLNKK